MTPDDVRAALHLLATTVKELRDAEEARSDGILCGADTVGDALRDLISATFPETGLEPALANTAADPSTPRFFGSYPYEPLCAAVLGRYGDVTGYMFKDNDGNARCAHARPCPEHQ